LDFDKWEYEAAMRSSPVKNSDGTARCERDKEIIILMSKYTIYNMKIFPSLQKKLRTERNGFPGPLNSKSGCAYYYYIYSKHEKS
jgi:hypothetical protein